MRKGKMIAQGAHAAHQAIIKGLELVDDQRIMNWLIGSYTKIVVGVSSEEELLTIYKEAQGVTLSSLIKDLGKTEFKEPTYTAVAIGPDTNEVIDNITGHLKLL